MADPFIEAKADRYVRLLRRMFLKMSDGVWRPGDDELLARARVHAIRMLSLDRGRREAKRKRYEMTRDLFEANDGGAQ